MWSNREGGEVDKYRDDINVTTRQWHDYRRYYSL